MRLRHALAAAFIALLIGQLFGAIQLSRARPYDSHDGYLFLIQSRRLSHPEYSHFPYASIRPRGPVVLYSALNELSQTFLGRFPTLSEYRTLMTLVALTAATIWVGLGTLLFGIHAGLLTGILFVLHYLFLINASLCLVDIFSSLLWASFFLLYFLQHKRGDGRFANVSCIAMGALSGFIGMTKYQHFLLFPCFLLVHKVVECLSGRKALWNWRSIGWGALSFVMVVDLTHRIFGQVWIGFWEVLSLYGAAASAYLAPNIKLEPWWLYLHDFYYAYGALFLLLLALSLMVFVVHLPQLSQKNKSSWRWPAFWTWFLTTGGFILVNQVIKHKEARYMLPFIPAFCVLFASLICQVRFAKVPILKTQWGRGVFFALVALSLIHPLRRSIEKLNEAPKAYLAHREFNRFIQQVNLANAEGESCQYLRMCNGMLGDHVMLPRIHYHNPKLDVRYFACSPGQYQNLTELRKNLIPSGVSEVTGEVCYVRNLSASVMELVKPWKTHLTKSQARQLESTGYQCVLAEGKSHCYQITPFFRS